MHAQTTLTLVLAAIESLREWPSDAAPLPVLTEALDKAKAAARFEAERSAALTPAE